MSASIVWRQCACYVWPLVVDNGFVNFRECKYCGQEPRYPAATPADGRAHPLPPMPD